ncbi:uncharacterized protein LOC102307919 [Haplochromis burtoni]|uniref:uncharacterized protein LOC102307919 n=1 Tax=Haplochromis burtoni TaxID=8153 RepID=UPI001C2CF066|nr:uncharacterized protein LOC102307919 [Haplochromis burtoni]
MWHSQCRPLAVPLTKLMLTVNYKVTVSTVIVHSSLNINHLVTSQSTTFPGKLYIHHICVLQRLSFNSPWSSLMDGLHVILLVLLGVVSCSQNGISVSVLEVTAQPGDNITLYCDCKMTIGVHIIWYRKCSHDNTVVLRYKSASWFPLEPLSHLHFVKNESSNSRDLVILNITDSDEGLYYCGTEEQHGENKDCRFVYTYGNSTTRLKLVTIGKPLIVQEQRVMDVGVTRLSWMMMFAPAFTILTSFSFILVYHTCQKAENKSHHHQKRLSIKRQSRQNMDEDLCLTTVVFLSQDAQTHHSDDKEEINN